MKKPRQIAVPGSVYEHVLAGDGKGQRFPALIHTYVTKKFIRGRLKPGRMESWMK
jgi:hypothetical protein